MTAPGRWPAAINPDTTTLGDLERLAALVAAREPIEDAAPSGREATPPTELDDDEPDELDYDDQDEGHLATARSRRAPYVIGAVTAGVGTFAWSCAQVAEAFGGPEAAAAVGAITWVGTAGAVPVLRTLFRHRIPDAWRRRWWLSTASAAAWVDVMVAKGPDLLTVDTAVGMASALLLGGVALGSRWAADHEVLNPADELPAPPPPPAPEPVPLAPAPRRPQIDTSRAAEIERDWAEKVAGGRNPIAPGSTLTNRIHLPHGYRWLVQLDRDGTVGVTSLENDGIAASVALKLGIRASHVMLERLPGDDDREDQALLTVVTQNALAAGVHFDGPDYVDGIIRIGKYGDGTGKASWVAKNDTGVQSGVVTGGQRSGKSSLLALLGMSYRASNEWIVLFGDGDIEGRSSPLLGQVAHDFARGPAEVLQQLQGLEALRFVRGPLMGTLTEGPDGRPVPMRPGQKPAEKLLPAPHLPGIVWILDEFHLLAKDEELQKVQFVPRVGRFVRLLAKYGVSLVLGTHSALGDDFAGDSAFRGMVSQGNNVSMRNNNKSEQGIITNGGFSPNTLPTGGGYAFLDDGVRRAMIRTPDPETMADYLPQVLACGRWDKRSEDAYRRYRTAAALDVVANFHESRERLEAFDAAIASGAPLPGSPEEKAALAEAAAAEAAAAEAAAAGKTPPGAQAEPTSLGGFAVPGAVGGNVVPIRPDVAPPAEPSPAPAAPAVPVARLSDKAQQVLATLRSRPGHWTTGELADATGLPKPDVSKALRDLVLLGLAHRPTARQGVYAAGPAA